jgi:hypothetical protein
MNRCPCCGQAIKAAKPKRSRKKSIWPAPVFVTHWSHGETVRMPVHNTDAANLDWERGFRINSILEGAANWQRKILAAHYEVGGQKVECPAAIARKYLNMPMALVA